VSLDIVTHLSPATSARIARGIFTGDDDDELKGEESDAERAPDPADSDAAHSDAEVPVKKSKKSKNTKKSSERAPDPADPATEAPAKKSKPPKKTNVTPEVVAEVDVTAKPPRRPKPKAKTAASKLAPVVRSLQPGPAAVRLVYFIWERDFNVLQAAQEAADVADTPSFAADDVLSLTAPWTS
jgi:hypothetical protein